MTANTPKSRKAKGRIACQEVRDALVKFGNLLYSDIEVKTTSVDGEDLWLSSRARERFPFTFEVKNQESIRIWECIKQADSHAEKYSPGNAEKIPIALLVFRRSHEDLRVCLKLDDFLSLICK
jgi:hypothetical protein